MFVFILPHLLLWYRGWEIHGFAYSKYPRRPGVARRPSSKQSKYYNIINIIMLFVTVLGLVGIILLRC